MNKNHFLFSLLILISNLINAQNKTYYVGHSLVNEHLPHMVYQIATQKGLGNDYRHHINVGACLNVNWVDTGGYAAGSLWNPTLGMDEYHGTNHAIELLKPFQNIVVTECINLDFGVNNLDSSAKYAANFINLAKTSNPTVKKFVYATWEGVNDSYTTWRNQVQSSISRWETLADKINALTGGGTTYIVPGNIAMLALQDSIDAGKVPTFTGINNAFLDYIHLSKEGNYFMACVMAATVYQINPQGTSKIMSHIYANDSAVANPALRTKLQQIAFDVVCNYARSGLNCSGTVDIENPTTPTNFGIFPNPIHSNLLTIHSTPNASYNIYDLNGALLINGALDQEEQQIDIRSLSDGVYIVRCNNVTKKLVVNK